MKKTKLLLVVVTIFCMTSTAESKDYAEYELPIVVKNVQEWSADYPTVTNNWDGMLLRSIEGSLPPILSLVTSINGKSTKGMSKEEFNIIMMSKGSSTLEYQKKEKGEVTSGKCAITYHTSIFWGDGMNMEYPEVFPSDISIKNNKSTQFFSLNTYEIQVGQETGLDEKAILDVAGRALRAKGLAKAENGKPDILLTLTTGKDQWNGKSVILNMLDAEKHRNGITQVIWSLEISGLKKEIKESLPTIKSAISKYCANYPFEMPAFCNEVNTIGIGFESKETMYTGRVIEVLKGTDAYKKGLRGGYTLLSGYEGADLYPIGGARKHWFIAGRKQNQKNWSVLWILYLPIIPNYWRNETEHYLSYGGDGNGILNKRHFKIKNSQGKKFTVLAPFFSKTFNFTYIRY